MNQTGGKIKVGISSCLLGEAVRYDGGHKHSDICTDELSSHFEFIPVCPEVGIGLGVPRKPIRLVGNSSDPDLVAVDNKNHIITQDMKDFARGRMETLDHLAGYIFIKGSPSCGLFQVKVYDNKGFSQEEGRGIYAKVVTDTYPLLPVEEAGRLADEVTRDIFVARVIAYHDFLTIKRGGLTVKKLFDFHSKNKNKLGMLSLESYSFLTNILNDAYDGEVEESGVRYLSSLMRMLGDNNTGMDN